MMAPTSVSEHAFQRLHQRWGEIFEVPLDELENFIMSALSKAVFVEYERGNDQEFWQIEGILLVVSGGVVRTILPPGSARPANRRPFSGRTKTHDM